MTQDMESNSHYTYLNPKSPTAPPLTNNHFLLPLPGSKYAPRTLTFKRRQHELAHFLEVYDHICSHYDITDSAERCKGIITYCTSRVARMVEKLPSFNQGDYGKLVKDLVYFLEDDDHTYSINKVQSFTRRWRHKRIESLEHFKRYHRKYLELVGKAVGSRSMTESDYNRYFWEGIHSSLRRKIENRMLVTDPDLDVSVPFDDHQVVKAAGYIFNRRRFDQHLFGKATYNSSDTDSEDNNYKHKQAASDSESDEEDDSDASQDSRMPVFRKKRIPHSPKLPPKIIPQPKHTKEPENNEVSKLITRMNKLSLGQLNKADPKQKAYLADVLKNLVEPPRNQHNPIPPRQDRYQPRPAPPRQEGYPQRDPPPHHQFREPVRPIPERSEMHCFGCGRMGHRIVQCRELNALIEQGAVIRNSAGRLQWPDGSTIYKDREDSWIQGINKALKRTNIVKAEKDYEESEEEMCPYVGFTREEDDASSDEQEELGWTSGHVSDCYALGAERNPKVSKDARRQVQFNPPSTTQGMKQFPQHRNPIGGGRQGPPISHGIHHNSSQPGTPKRITPLDVHKGKFEGKSDDQFLPMEVDQVPVVKPGNKLVKVTPDKDKSSISKVTNPRPRTGRNTSEIVQEIMKMPLTVTVEEAVNISPTLRRDLMYASKPAREAFSPAQERKDKSDKTEKIERNALGSSLLQPLPQDSDGYQLCEPREDLPTVEARIGRARMEGVYDSGSQINVLSDKYAKVSGLPVTTEGTDRYRITGVNGGLARCVGIIPSARIYITENELVTVGDLIVIEHAGFDLLLGRPWITMNRAGTFEKDEGTYLTFRSRGRRYSTLAAENPHYKGKREQTQDWKQSQIPVSSNYAVAAVNWVCESEVPDSEEEQDLPPADGSINNDWEQGQQLSQTADNKEEQEVGAKQEEPDEEDQCWLDPPPESPKPKSTGLDQIGSIKIETELHESYIKMVKKGITDAEWDQFCKAKKVWLRRDQNRWKEWKKAQAETEIVEGNPDPEIPSDPSTEPSETLVTMETDDCSPSNPVEPSSPEGASVVTTVRRSKRKSKVTQKAQESEEWQKMMKRRRAYEREEKITRKVVTRQIPKKRDKKVSSFCAKLSTSTPKPDVRDTGSIKTELPHPPKENAPILTMVSTTENLDNYQSCWRKEDPTAVNPITWPIDELKVHLLSPNAKLPIRGSELAAGYDLSSSEDTIVPAGGKALVKTGISISIPKGTYGRIAPRSGLALKHAIGIGAGVIDEDYTGPIGIILFNHGTNDFPIQIGDCVAQLILEQIKTPPVVEVKGQNETLRGSSGFGSTGIKHPDSLKHILNQEENLLSTPQSSSQKTSASYQPKSTPPMNISRTTPSPDVLNPLENSLEDSTAPTTPELTKQLPVIDGIVDSDDIWGKTTGECQERTYQCGKSKFHQRSLLQPREAKKEAVQVRPFKELPKWSHIMGWKEDYEEGKTYLGLRDNEIRKIIAWCDNTPEYCDGGFQFLIHQTGESIATTLIRDKSLEKRSRTIGERVLDLQRWESGELYENPSVHTVSNGRFQQYLQKRDRRIGTNYETTISPAPGIPDDEWSDSIGPSQIPTVLVDSPTLSETKPISTNPPSDRTFSCFLGRFAPEKGSEESTIASEEEKGMTDMNQTNLEDRDCPMQYTHDWANTSGLRDDEVQRQINLTFPEPYETRYASPY